MHAGSLSESMCGLAERSKENGVRVQPDPLVPVEEVLLTVGDQVEHSNLSYTSRINRGVVVFVTKDQLVVVPSTRVTESDPPSPSTLRRW